MKRINYGSNVAVTMFEGGSSGPSGSSVKEYLHLKFTSWTSTTFHYVTFQKIYYTLNARMSYSLRLFLCSRIRCTQLRKRIVFSQTRVRQQLEIKTEDVLYKNERKERNKCDCAFSVWMSSMLIFVAYCILCIKQYVLNSM